MNIAVGADPCMLTNHADMREEEGDRKGLHGEVILEKGPARRRGTQGTRKEPCTSMRKALANAPQNGEHEGTRKGLRTTPYRPCLYKEPTSYKKPTWVRTLAV